MTQFGKRTVETRHVPTLVDYAPFPHLANFVDTIGKLVPTVLDGDLGVVLRQIAAINVSDARHKKLIDSERFELAM